jgi:hypothetical protein
MSRLVCSIAKVFICKVQTFVFDTADKAEVPFMAKYIWGSTMEMYFKNVLKRIVALETIEWCRFELEPHLESCSSIKQAKNKTDLDKSINFL